MKGHVGFPGKIVWDFPSVTLFVFWQKSFFCEFCEKISNLFFNEIDYKKNFRNFLQSISLKNKFDIFSQNSQKKIFLPKNKRGGHNPNNFSKKNLT